MKIKSYLIDSPQPSNLSYLWNFGSLLGLCLGIQIITGIALAMHYNQSVLDGFNSVEHIIRDVNNGWMIRYLHSNIASTFFLVVYLHISRGLYYGSYKAQRTLIWTIGTVLFIYKVRALLEWGWISPPKPHAFVSLPLQSKISFKNVFKFIAIGFITFIVGYALRILISYIRDIDVLTQIYCINCIMYYLSMSYIGLGLREFLIKYTSFQDIVNFLKTFFSYGENSNGKMTMDKSENIDLFNKKVTKDSKLDSVPINTSKPVYEPPVIIDGADKPKPKPKPK